MRLLWLSKLLVKLLLGGGMSSRIVLAVSHLPKLLNPATRNACTSAEGESAAEPECSMCAYDVVKGMMHVTAACAWLDNLPSVDCMPMFCVCAGGSREEIVRLCCCSSECMVAPLAPFPTLKQCPMYCATIAIRTQTHKRTSASARPTRRWPAGSSCPTAWRTTGWRSARFLCRRGILCDCWLVWSVQGAWA
jgi:hypothetical protein